MSLFLYKRGQGAKRRVVHLATFNRHGEIAGAWCRSRVPFDTSCNLPLGLKVCKRCRKAQEAPNGD